MRVELIQKLLVVNTEAAAPKTLILLKPAVVTKETSSTSSSNTTEQAILTSKYNKKTKFCFVDQTFQKKLAVQSKCESSLQKVANGFCLSVVKNIFTMKLIADLQPILLNRLQCTVDKDDPLVSETYRLAQQTANNARNLETPTTDKFVESLHLDNNENLMFTESINNSDHLLRLSDSHKPTCGKSEDQRLASVKEKMAKIKTS